MHVLHVFFFVYFIFIFATSPKSRLSGKSHIGQFLPARRTSFQTHQNLIWYIFLTKMEAILVIFLQPLQAV